MSRNAPTSPRPDNGHPTDGDLHQMTDDGCPLTPDPAQWGDDDWRDNIGSCDTFGDERSGGPAGRGGP